MKLHQLNLILDLEKYLFLLKNKTEFSYLEFKKKYPQVPWMCGKPAEDLVV